MPCHKASHQSWKYLPIRWLHPRGKPSTLACPCSWRVPSVLRSRTVRWRDITVVWLSRMTSYFDTLPPCREPGQRAIPYFAERHDIGCESLTFQLPKNGAGIRRWSCYSCYAHGKKDDLMKSGKGGREEEKKKKKEGGRGGGMETSTCSSERDLMADHRHTCRSTCRPGTCASSTEM